jgi:hypothetical protein
MKGIALASTLLVCSGVAFAQAEAPKAPVAAVAKANCGAKPEYPGKLAMQSDLRRNSFKREVDKYKECMLAYVEEHKQQQKAHFDAANGAIQDFNETMKKIAADQEAAKD